MKTFWSFCLLVCGQIVVSTDYYVGMFKRNDFLVAQDVVYKEASHFGYAIASYGRSFKCPITYFRVNSRLGMGRGPFTTIVRGGLHKKYIAVRIKSSYNLPVSVIIYVGCENKSPSTVKRLTRNPIAGPELTTEPTNEKTESQPSLTTTFAETQPPGDAEEPNADDPETPETEENEEGNEGEEEEEEAE